MNDVGSQEVAEETIDSRTEVLKKSNICSLESEMTASFLRSDGQRCLCSRKVALKETMTSILRS